MVSHNKKKGLMWQLLYLLDAYGSFCAVLETQQRRPAHIVDACLPPNARVVAVS